MKGSSFVPVLFAALASSASALLDVDASGDAVLHLVSKEITEKHGAYCLDGTPSAFYYAPARDAALQNDWVIYFKGGGACTSIASCKSRSKGTSGSSHGLTKTYNRNGPMSSSNTTNPLFANANRVVVWYCDGLFFASDRKDKVEDMYFRGFPILKAVLEELTSNFGLDKAEKLLLTGCSSGGYSAYLHTDFVGDYIHSVSKDIKVYKSMPLSGLFVNGSNYKGEFLFGKTQGANFALQNATSGVSKRCVEAEKENTDVCAAPEMNFAYAKYPVFLANSMLDYGTILASFLLPAPPGVDTKCLRKLPECNSSTIKGLNTVQDKFHSLITTVKAKGASLPAMEKPGNGAFLSHCVNHCQVESEWATLKLGETTLREAFTKWWLDTDRADAKKHTHIETCHNSDTKPYECNPTCKTQ